MALGTLITFMLVVLATLAWATTQPSAADSAGRASAEPVSEARVSGARPQPQRCRHAREAVPFYRVRTWDWQQLRYGELADHTPIVRGKSCRWARLTAEVWVDRSAAARRSFKRWYRERGHVVEQLNRVLASTPMAGAGVSLERWGRAYGVSPYFMVATAATESSIGHAACGHGGFNAWGLGNCGTAWLVPSFRSWDDAIAYYARFLAERWPGHSTPYSFRGYAACDECWGRKVSEWMGRLFGVPAVTRYP